MKGGYRKKWKEWAYGVGRNRTVRTDHIPIQSILLFGLKLTTNDNLPKHTVSEIQKLYED